MQKRSHKLLASTLLKDANGFSTRRYELAFLFGSFQPDCNPLTLEKSRTVQSVNTQNLQLMRPGLWRPDDMWPAADRRGSQY